jgi:hypothetical protein
MRAIVTCALSTLACAQCHRLAGLPPPPPAFAGDWLVDPVDQRALRAAVGHGVDRDRVLRLSVQIPARGWLVLIASKP